MKTEKDLRKTGKRIFMEKYGQNYEGIVIDDIQYDDGEEDNSELDEEDAMDKE